MSFACGPLPPSGNDSDSSGSTSDGTTTTGVPPDPTTTLPPQPTTIDPPQPTTIDPTTTTDPLTTTIDPSTATDTTTDDTTGDTDSTTEEPSGMITPLALEVADFDDDGENDLLVLGLDAMNQVAARLSRGLGDGTFAADIDAQVSGASSAFPVVGQLDGEGGVDVLVGKGVGVVEVLRWAGDSLEPWMELQTDHPALTHKIADVDDDGDDDIAWLWWDDDGTSFGVSVRPSDAGGFADPVDTPVGVIADVGIAPQSLAIGRLDGDASADALIWEADKEAGFLRLFGAPDGTFVAQSFVVPSVRPWVAAIRDVDEDGAADILALERTPRRIVVASGDGNGGFTVTSAVEIVAPFVPLTMAVADIDADMHLDVAVIDDQTPEVRVFRGAGDGSFLAPTSIPLPSGAVNVHAAQFDDGDAFDLALATFAIGEVTVALFP